jgi:hypothetical protein
MKRDDVSDNRTPGRASLISPDTLFARRGWCGALLAGVLTGNALLLAQLHVRNQQGTALMIDRSLIREHMDVIASDGGRIGVVDSVQGDLIKLARKDLPDGEHHYVSLADVERVDKHVHLMIGRVAVFGAAAATAAGVSRAAAAGTPPRGAAKDTKGAPPASGQTAAKEEAASPLIKNPAVPDAKPRRNFMLPWVLLGLAVLALLAVALAGNRGGEEQRREAIARDQAGQGSDADGSTNAAEAARME